MLPHENASTRPQPPTQAQQRATPARTTLYTPLTASQARNVYWEGWACERPREELTANLPYRRHPPRPRPRPHCPPHPRWPSIRLRAQRPHAQHPPHSHPASPTRAATHSTSHPRQRPDANPHHNAPPHQTGAQRTTPERHLAHTSCQPPHSRYQHSWPISPLRRYASVSGDATHPHPTRQQAPNIYTCRHERR